MIDAEMAVAIGAGIVLGILGRWWLGMLVPLVAIPIVYLGIDSEWWGEPWMLGDLWQAAMVVATAKALAFTAVAIAAGGAFMRWVRSRDLAQR